MQNMLWYVTDIFCILSIFQHIPTYWSSYFLAYSCIFSLLSSQRKLAIESQNTRYISPENRFIVARQDFFQVLIRQGIISCRFEYDHTIIVTCKWKRKVMIQVLLCPSMMGDDWLCLSHFVFTWILWVWNFKFESVTVTVPALHFNLKSVTLALTV